MSSDPALAVDHAAPRADRCDCVYTLMWTRFLMHWRLKLLLTLTITPVFLALYLSIQRYAAATQLLELTFFDHAAGFNVWWVYIYVSQYLIVPLPPLLAHTRVQLWRLVIGLSITSFAAFAIFLIYPIACPRPPHPEVSNFVYDWLVSVDTKGNAFPSLHVGLSTLAALYAHRVIDEGFSRRARVTLLSIIWIWTALIAWSTMATKQHYFVDVVGGFAIALLGHWIAWRVPLDRVGK